MRRISISFVYERHWSPLPASLFVVPPCKNARTAKPGVPTAKIENQHKGLPAHEPPSCGAGRPCTRHLMAHSKRHDSSPRPAQRRLCCPDFQTSERTFACLNETLWW